MLMGRRKQVLRCDVMVSVQVDDEMLVTYLFLALEGSIELRSVRLQRIASGGFAIWNWTSSSVTWLTRMWDG